ncbi:hypothetical protein [Neomoorella thermoacetica]|uniref:hypothetical protein n=1 Tax=Neomoorella thermoacetica TaxID=1525 RepID=UPI0008FB6655|nr:hypothetical protein [Moorella thermoacetica]APC09328.1 hypothetical protein MTJW_21790 [Moorella thermoacetica]
MPAFKLLTVFVLMMVLLWLRAPLAPVIFGSSCLLAIIYRLSPAAFELFYRHIWEYCLPLYPSLLIIAGVCGIPLAQLILDRRLF